MGSPDSIKQIVFRPHGHEGRALLEIVLESGATIQKEIPSDPFMRAIAELIKYQKLVGRDSVEPTNIGGA